VAIKGLNWHTETLQGRPAGVELWAIKIDEARSNEAQTMAVSAKMCREQW